MRRAARSFLLPLPALAALAAGCAAVGPTYRPATPAAPASFTGARTAPARTPGPEAPGADTLGAWWTAFGDARLEALESRALAGNLDLRVAAARVREARALRGVAAGAMRPEIAAGAAAERQRLSRTADLGGAVPGQPDPATLFDAGFDASWEIDLFGGRRRAVEVADAELAAAAAEARAVRAMVAAEVARNYIEWRAAAVRRTLAARNAAAQADTLALVETRRAAGLAGDFDAARARAQLEATRAAVPALAAAEAAAAHRVAVLLGEAPSAAECLLGAADADGAAIPRGPAALDPGLPADVLRRRPDVRAAERRVAAAVARVGVATADLYPRVTLLAALGGRSSRPGSLFEADGRRGLLGGAVAWPLFAGGRIRANVAAQDARADAAAAAWERTVLVAFEDVENALVRHGREEERRARLADAVAASERAVALADDLYRHGVADFLAVLDAQRQLFARQDDLAASDAQAAQQLVALYTALGGGS